MKGDGEQLGKQALIHPRRLDEEVGVIPVQLTHCRGKAQITISRSLWCREILRNNIQDLKMGYMATCLVSDYCIAAHSIFIFVLPLKSLGKLLPKYCVFYLFHQRT